MSEDYIKAILEKNHVGRIAPDPDDMGDFDRFTENIMNALAIAITQTATAVIDAMVQSLIEQYTENGDRAPIDFGEINDASMDVDDDQTAQSSANDSPDYADPVASTSDSDGNTSNANKRQRSDSESQEEPLPKRRRDSVSVNFGVKLNMFSVQCSPNPCVLFTKFGRI